VAPGVDLKTGLGEVLVRSSNAVQRSGEEKERREGERGTQKCRSCCGRGLKERTSSGFKGTALADLVWPA